MSYTLRHVYLHVEVKALALFDNILSYLSIVQCPKECRYEHKKSKDGM